MKLFTKQEKNIIGALSIIFILGLFGVFVKKQVLGKQSGELKLVGVSEEIVNIYSNSMVNKDDEIQNLSININEVGEIEMAYLPGIGPVLAKRIIQKRIELDGFKTQDDLLKVSGIGPKVLSKIKPHIILE